MSSQWRSALHLRLVRACALGAIGFLLCACEEPKRTPIRYLIPDGYVGWIQVDYDVPGGIPPEHEDGYLVFRLPPNGHLVSSAHFEAGWASDEFYYVDAHGTKRRLPLTMRGRGGMVWGMGIGQRDDGPQFNQEFIGTEKQYREQTGETRF